MNLKTIGVGVVVLVLVGFLVQQLRHQLASAEDKIRYAIEDAVEDFNDEDWDLMDLFHRDYEDASGYDRSDVRDAIRYLMIITRERERIELREQQLDIRVDEDAGTARVTLGFAIYRDEGTEPWWDAHGKLEFERRGGHWRVARSADWNHGDRGR